METLFVCLIAFTARPQEPPPKDSVPSSLDPLKAEQHHFEELKATTWLLLRKAEPLHNGTLWICRPDGKDLESLELGAGWYRPQWSRHGRSILAIRMVEQQSQICEIDWPEKTVKVILRTDTRFDGLTYNSSRDLIAYTEEVAGRRVLRILSRKDGTFRTMDTGEGLAGCPSWNPDGTALAYESTVDLSPRTSTEPFIEQQIWIVTLVDAARRGITNDQRLHHALPSWSPDGTGLALLTGKRILPAGFEYSLRILDPMSGAVTSAIWPKPGQTFGPGVPPWSPVGRLIASTICNTGKMFGEVWIISTDRSSIWRQVPLPEAEFQALSWSPVIKDR